MKRGFVAGIGLALVACSAGEHVGPSSPLLDKSPGVCSPVTLRVRAKADPGGDGSAKNPFADLQTALGVAGKISCDVQIDLGPGDYFTQGPFVISRPIAIKGQGKPRLFGSFLVQTPGNVRLENLTIDKAVGAALATLTLKGQLKTTVELDAVYITDAAGYGIYQDGGTLIARNVEVANTHPTEDPASGTAITVVGGTHATLTGPSLHDNIHALYAQGAGTVVDGENMLVERSTGIHPAALARLVTSCNDIPAAHFGAVEFADGAAGTGTLWDILNSGITGVWARSGGSVRTTSMTVRSTTWVEAPSHPSVTCGGFGITAVDGAVELNDFVIVDSELCGVTVGLGASTGVDLHNGSIMTAPVGACVQVDGYDTARLRDHVRYIDVGVPLQATSYPLPTLP